LASLVECNSTHSPFFKTIVLLRTVVDLDRGIRYSAFVGEVDGDEFEGYIK
jgi:hypothetical protein